MARYIERKHSTSRQILQRSTPQLDLSAVHRVSDPLGAKGIMGLSTRVVNKLTILSTVVLLL